MKVALVGILLSVVLTGAATAASALPLVTLSIETQRGSRAFTVELATDPQSQKQGLMYRRQLAPDAGMLFDFQETVMLSFWMKNTILPLDIIFIRSDGTISSVAPDAVPLSLAPITSVEPVRAVLEINGGRARELGIRAGDRVRAQIFPAAR